MLWTISEAAAPAPAIAIASSMPMATTSSPAAIIEPALIEGDAGIASSITGSSIIAMPAMTFSTSLRSMPGGTAALKAKGNSSSTVTFVKRGEPRS